MKHSKSFHIENISRKSKDNIHFSRTSPSLQFRRPPSDCAPSLRSLRSLPAARCFAPAYCRAGPASILAGRLCSIARGRKCYPNGYTNHTTGNNTSSKKKMKTRNNPIKTENHGTHTYHHHIRLFLCNRNSIDRSRSPDIFHHSRNPLCN